MWVYIGTSELKNAYIGEVYEYSYTFKWKTAAEIWNEWTTMVGTPSVNSEWFNGNECIIAKDIPSLATVKRITITWTVVGQGWNNTAIQLWLGKWTWWWTGGAFYEVYWSSYGGLKVKYYDGTSYTWNAVWNATNSTYKPTLTIDLENKIITWTLSWFSNSTYSINDTQVSNIRTFTHLHCYISATSWAISDISITIE